MCLAILSSFYSTFFINEKLGTHKFSSDMNLLTWMKPFSIQQFIKILESKMLKRQVELMLLPPVDVSPLTCRWLPHAHFNIEGLMLVAREQHVDI